MLTKSQFSYPISIENPDEAPAVEVLIAKVFGPGMCARAAHHLRGKTPHEVELSFVARAENQLVGSVRLTRFVIGDQQALLLGPLGVLSTHKNCGIGRELMRVSIDAARAADIVQLVFLVGDLAYYKPFGFKQVASGQIILPRPADPTRLLACELVEGAMKTHFGVARALIE